MEKIKKIPVIGYIVRLIIAVLKLPKHVDFLYQSFEKEQHAYSELYHNTELINQSFNHLVRTQDELKQIQGEQKCQVALLEEVDKRRQDMISELISWNSDRMTEIKNLTQMYEDVRQLHVGEDYLKKLNLLLSINPTVWGSEDRLHISPLATMSSCFFNTNSGSITIGDYTFCGSGVSILAGSHDQNLTGLLRRDVEITEGCDIVIGDGVWLASNCTVLGPAKIGNNAVIAAGAVVVPGTVVPANTIYAGIPAKLIHSIDICDVNTMKNPAIFNALDRNGGILFVDGWTEKREIDVKGIIRTGHYLIENIAVMYCKDVDITLYYWFQGKEECNLVVLVDGLKEMKYSFAKKEGTFDVSVSKFSEEYNMIHKVEIRLETSGIDFFVSTIL